MIRCSVSRLWRLVAPVLLLFASQALAEVLPHHDSGPLTGIFGFPESTEGGKVVERGQYRWNASIVVASHNIDETRASEVFRLDGESTRLAFTYQRGLWNRLDIGIEVPYVWHQSGSLDSIIESWHDFFSFPDGPRSIREQDQLEFFYADSQQNLIDISNNAHGIGDVRVVAGWQLSTSENRSTALRLGIKLPTGSGDELLGSGGTDLSLALASDYDNLWGNPKTSGFYRASLTILGRPDLLANRYKNVVGQLSIGLGYRAHRNVDLRLQSRIRSAVYDSKIENLGETSMALVFGTDLRLSDRYRLTLSVSEDVKVDSAPDVSFQIALVYGAE